MVNPTQLKKSPAGNNNPPIPAAITPVAKAGSRCDPIVISSDDESAAPMAPNVRLIVESGATLLQSIDAVPDEDEEEDNRADGKDDTLPKNEDALKLEKAREVVREMGRVAIERMRKRKRESSDLLEEPRLEAYKVPRLVASEGPSQRALEAPRFQAPEAPRFRAPEAPRVRAPEGPQQQEPEPPRVRAPERVLYRPPAGRLVRPPSGWRHHGSAASGSRLREPPSWLHVDRFPGKVFNAHPDHSQPRPKEYPKGWEAKDAQKFTVVSSVKGECVAAGVAWPKPGSVNGEWEAEGFPVPYANGNMLIGQLYAVAKALQLARERLPPSAGGDGSVRRPRVNEVFILSDCIGTLKRIDEYNAVTGAGASAVAQRNVGVPTFGQGLDDVVAAGQALWESGASIELHLVLGAAISGRREALAAARNTFECMLQSKEMAACNAQGVSLMHPSRASRL